MDGGLRQRQQVLRPMVGLARKQGYELLLAFLLGVVARDLRSADDFTVLVGYRRYR